MVYGFPNPSIIQNPATKTTGWSSLYMHHLSWTAQTQIGSCCVPQHCWASVSDALLIVPVGLLDQSRHWMGSLIVFFCLGVYPNDACCPYFEREYFNLYKSDMLWNSANTLRQFHKETSASLTLLKLWTEQKNSCFVFFIVRSINQCVPSFFMWRHVNSSTCVRVELESSTTLKGGKNHHLDTILSPFYPAPILNLSQHYRILPSHLFSVFEVSISQGVFLPKFCVHVLSPYLLLLQQCIAPLLHFAILTAKEAILCHSQNCVFVWESGWVADGQMERCGHMGSG
jgi:hypothetical protein